MGERLHPCLTCGACCAFFRVSFYWSETDESLGPHAVPAELTDKVNAHLACMKYEAKPALPRCVALKGTIGTSVACGIYENRSSTCRNFEASYESGNPNPRCDQARAKHGIPPLKPEDWQHL